MGSQRSHSHKEGFVSLCNSLQEFHKLIPHLREICLYLHWVKNECVKIWGSKYPQWRLSYASYSVTFESNVRTILPKESVSVNLQRHTPHSGNFLETVIYLTFALPFPSSAQRLNLPLGSWQHKRLLLLLQNRSAQVWDSQEETKKRQQTRLDFEQCDNHQSTFFITTSRMGGAWLWPWSQLIRGELQQ